MLSLISLPAKIISILEGNISAREIAAGVCLGLFLGFIPLSGPMAILLVIFFFVFKINRVATLLTLPIFKSVYLLGIYRLTDLVGTYILEKSDYLTGFWRWVTHLPVIAYLDINNTLIAGGIVVSAALCIPVYFIAKKLSISLSVKYSEKIKNSALAKWIPGVKLMGLVGDDSGSTLKNVKKQVTLTLKEKINKIRGKGQSKSLFKRVNIVGVTIIIVLLLTFHFGVGFFISPAFSSFIVDNINKYSGSKITIDKVNIWPLTLSFSLKGMKVFDPEREDVRIAKIDDSSVSISPLGFLSRRVVFSNIRLVGAEINIEGTADGSFNINRLAAPKKGSQKAAVDLEWRSVMEKKDLFGKICEIIKKRSSKKNQEKLKEERKNAKQVTKTVEALPKGKLVRFKNAKDLYVFEIKNLDIADAYIKIKMEGNTAELTNARIRLGRIAYDPENGMKVDLVELRGNVNKGASPDGKFDIFFSKGADKNGQKVVFRAELNDIDMDAVRFAYEDSLPVHVSKGFITLKSKTSIEGDVLDSRNEIYLKGHTLEPKMGGIPMVGFIPMPALCNAINRVDPLTLKFSIGGTTENPEFGGFQESLMVLVKPYITDLKENIKNEGLKVLDRIFNKK